MGFKSMLHLFKILKSMKYLHYLVVVITLVFASTINAQTNKTPLSYAPSEPISEYCGFDAIHQQLLQDSIYKINLQRNEDNLRSFKSGLIPRNGITVIPVVVHVMHNGDALGTGTNITDAQIQSAIDNMSEAFSHTGVYNDGNHNGYTANTNARFALAQTAPDGSSTNGIIRVDVSGEAWQATYDADGIRPSGGSAGVAESTVKALSIWPGSDYMNIWLVNRINGGGLCFGTIGYAYFPGGPSDLDGMVVIAGGFGYDPTNSLWPATLCNGLNLNGTADHEGGHYLDLFHTFQGDGGGSVCPSDADCGTNGDCCADIPVHRRTSFNCPADDPAGNVCTGGANTYIHNFMDYSSDACSHGFSNDQKARIDASITTNGGRNGFCFAQGALAPTGTYPGTPSCAPTNTNPGFLVGTKSISLNGTNWYSQASDSDGGYVNRIASQPTAQLQAGQMYTISITVVSTEQAHIYIDYNNDGDFWDANEDIGATPVLNPSGSLSFTVPSSGITLNQRLRIRIISDHISSAIISGPCHAPQYGQVEDYSVQLSGTLPVQLISFSGKSTNNGQLLEWETLNEQNNQYFAVEKSKDGHIFNSIGKVNAGGVDNRKQFYQYFDTTPHAGNISYYRLKIVDYDEHFTYSSIISITHTNKQEIGLYPNPAFDKVNISTSKGYQLPKVLEIYNQMGQFIESAAIIDHSISIKNLASGLYFIRIKNADGFTSLKLMVR